MAQSLCQRRFDQRVLVNIHVRFVERAFRGGATNASLRDLLRDPASPPSFDRTLSVRYRAGHALIVNRAFALQSSDSFFDFVGRVAPSLESLTNLYLGELATRKHRQGGHVGFRL